MRTGNLPRFLGFLAFPVLITHWAMAAATTAFPVLSLGQSARAQAMGDAFTGAADDLSSQQYNPAGLALWNREAFSLNHTSYLSDGFFENGAGSLPLPSLGTLAFQAGYLNYGTFDQRDASGNLTGSYTPLEYSLGGSLGFHLAGDLMGGLRTQWVQQNIAGNMATGLMWDFGLLCIPLPFLRFGVDLKNMGVETVGESLPQVLRLGAAGQVDFDRKGDNRILMDLDGVLLFQGGDGLRMGVEYANQHKYFVRAGYSYDFQDEGLGGLNGLNMGVGAFFDPVELDYCFSFLGDMGNTQQISLGINLGQDQGAQRNQPEAAMTASPGQGVQGGGTGSSKPVVLKFQVKGGDNLSAADLVVQGKPRKKPDWYWKPWIFIPEPLKKTPVISPDGPIWAIFPSSNPWTLFGPI